MSHHNHNYTNYSNKNIANNQEAADAVEEKVANEEQAVKLSNQSELLVQSREGAVVRILVNNNVAKSVKILAEYEPVDLQIATQNLEDVFLHYYGKGEKKDA